MESPGKKFTDLVEIESIQDTDLTVVRIDTGVKKTPMQKLSDYIKQKFIGWVFSDLPTTDKTIPGALKELNSSLTEDEKFLPPKASQNTFSNPLRIDTSGSYNIYEMKPGCVATEDASELSGSPVTEGAFYAWRELFWIPNASKNGGGKCIVRLTEAYPIPGRIWIAAYNTDISEWSQWAEIMPSS